ncbi:MAG: Fe-S cluster biogenesis protein NfuA [Halobacteriales archaeon]|jgi:Fe-S cluster biogenesis protein NfuA
MKVMSTESQDEANELRDRVGNFLMRNFPQIQMHGGDAAIRELDAETGEVTIQLTGACSGCGISPMTIQAIKSRMTKEIPEITKVHADTGMPGGGGPNPGGRGGSAESFPGPGSADEGEDDEGPEAPF